VQVEAEADGWWYACAATGGVSVETLALFVRFWLTTTPPLPEPAAKAARAQGSARWDNFVAALGRRLSQGPKLRQEIPEDIQKGGQM